MWFCGGKQKFTGCLLKYLSRHGLDEIGYYWAYTDEGCMHVREKTPNDISMH